MFGKSNAPSDNTINVAAIAIATCIWLVVVTSLLMLSGCSASTRTANDTSDTMFAREDYERSGVDFEMAGRFEEVKSTSSKTRVQASCICTRKALDTAGVTRL
mgnify:CR=1 FL=1